MNPFNRAWGVWVTLCILVLIWPGDTYCKETSGAVDTAVVMRQLPLEGGRNFRDLGGYEAADGSTVKWGKLYRSGTLAKLTDKDYAYLSGLGIATIVDLRTTEERESAPTQWRAGSPEHLTWDYSFEPDQSAMIRSLTAPDFNSDAFDTTVVYMYPELLASQKLHYRTLFSKLVDDNRPLLFHCTAGKDRTGMAAALILITLGVNEKTVIEDFELSERLLDPAEFFISSPQASEEERAALAFFQQLDDERRNAVLRARGSYLRAAFDAMISQSGSVMDYIKLELGVTDRDLQVLRSRYLDAPH